MEAADIITKHKNALINVVILLVAAVISLKVYTKQSSDLNSLKAQNEVEIEKNATLNQISELSAQEAVYKEFINAKEISSVLDVLSELAKESGVEIVSIRPETEEAKDIYIKYPYALSLTASTYHNIGDFISRLESHRDIFSVENINMSSHLSDGEKPVEKLGVTLTINTILAR